MLRDDLTHRLQSAVERLKGSVIADTDYSVEFTEPKNPAHGDFATAFALTNSKTTGAPPPLVAKALAEALQADSTFTSASAVSPGFVNVTLSDAYLAEWTVRSHRRGEALALSETDRPLKVLVEFVSANPNGPIHVGHGRGAAYGDSLARLLEATGHKVSREFYANDGTNSLQMQLFALSVRSRYRELVGLPPDFPEGGYAGDYIGQIAEEIRAARGDLHGEDGLEFWQPIAQDMMTHWQRRDLEAMHVVFDTWISEQSLHDSGKVAECMERLKQSGVIYEEDGALWLASSKFGDDKDRIVVRSNGQPTYIASDIAYHKDKFDRGWEHLINVWGADHHGYIARASAAIQALGYPKDALEILVMQLVRFLQGNEVVPMSKRSGDMVTLRELMEDVGPDVARFFFLMRSHDTHMDFDLDLAREHSEKNPVYYIQYAHARICSLLEKAKEAGFVADETCASDLADPAERDLIKKVCDLPFEVRRSAQLREVHRMTTYAIELARTYHNFYEKCRVLAPENPERTRARLLLCELTRSALRATFSILGISAPEKM